LIWYTANIFIISPHTSAERFAQHFSHRGGIVSLYLPSYIKLKRIEVCFMPFKQVNINDIIQMELQRDSEFKRLWDETKSISQRAAYASLQGKLNPNKTENLPPYIDDYEGISEEDRLKIWG
jgi:hypothetical protein